MLDVKCLLCVKSSKFHSAKLFSYHEIPQLRAIHKMFFEFKGETPTIQEGIQLKSSKFHLAKLFSYHEIPQLRAILRPLDASSVGQCSFIFMQFATFATRQCRQGFSLYMQWE